MQGSPRRGASAHLYRGSGSGSRLTALGDRYLRLREVETRADGLRVRFDSSWGTGELQSHLLGRFNAENLVLSLAVLLAWDMPIGSAIAALEQVRPVAGRMMVFLAPHQPRVVVDYAHTPDALERCSAACVNTRPVARCVFRVWGDRDRGKRAQMGQLRSGWLIAVITDDNPRSEDPQQIVEDILGGMSDHQNVHRA